MSDSDNYPFWTEVTIECQFRGSPDYNHVCADLKQVWSFLLNGRYDPPQWCHVFV